MKKLKFISVILIISMIISNVNIVLATNYSNDCIDELILDNNYENEEVAIIIELNDRPILDYEQAKEMGAKSFLLTNVAENLRKEIVKGQDTIKTEIINNINENVVFKGSYTKTINGFAAVVKQKDIDKIKNLEGVKNVYKDVIYDIPEVKSSDDVLDPKMATSKGMINLPIDLSAFPYKGEDTIVAVIDTGVGIDHELMKLSDDSKIRLTKDEVEKVFYQLNALEYAETANINLTPENLYKSAKFPFCFDYGDSDTDAFARRNDHGVHVSGTVAANGTAAKASNPNLEVKVLFDGVAREAQILGMKVFHDKKEGAATSNTVAAVEDAIALGADAINLSLGSTAGYTYEGQFDGYGDMFKKAREAGIIVIAAAGNDDRMGVGEKEGYNLPYAANPDTALVNSPATKYHAIAVASIENTKMYLKYILDSMDNIIVYNDNSNFVETFDKQNLEYVHCNLGLEQDFSSIDIAGKIALIERGEITFSEKVLNAEKNGAIGAIVYNNSGGGDELTAMQLDGSNIPAIFIGYSDGVILLNNENKFIKVDIENEDVFDNKSAYEMSDFTSWGCSPDLKLKPEITAPGGDIYSTITNNRYGSMSGTSMACPHIAGASALMQQYIRETNKLTTLNSSEKAQVIESLMMSTAKVVKNKNSKEYSPRRQGAGLLDIQAAINSDVYLINDESGKTKIELGEIESNEFTIEFDIVNFGDKPHSYELSSSMFTDKVENDGKYSLLTYDISYICDSQMIYEDKNININSVAIATTGSAVTTGSSIITVNPSEEKNIRISVSLDEEEMNEFFNDFENGYFVEGFVYLNSLDDGNEEKVNLSIPYMGFYNDWGKAPIVDGFYGYDEDSDVFYGSESYIYSLAQEDDGSVSGHYKIGKSINDEIYNWDWVAVSPNGDNYMETVGAKANFLRNAKYMFVDILDSDKDLIKRISTSLNETYQTKSFYDSKPIALMLNNWDCTDQSGNIVPDGQYYYRIKSVIDYPGASFQNFDIPVVVDTQKPQIISVDAEGSKCKVTVKDNHYIKYASMVDNVTNKIIKTIGLDVSDDENIFEFDKSLVKGSKEIKFVISDFAGNTSSHVTVIENNTSSEGGFTPGTSSQPESTEHEIIDGKLKVASEHIEIETDGLNSHIRLSDEIKAVITGADLETLVVNAELDTKTDYISFTVPKEIVKLLVQKETEIDLNISNMIKFAIKPNKEGELSIKIEKANELTKNEKYITTKYNFDLDVTLDGKSVDNSDKSIKVQLPTNGSYNINKLGVYTLDANNSIEYVMTYVNGSSVEFYPTHFSPYSLMIYDKTFDDIQNHWAKDSIENMASKYIVNGKTDKLFAPNDIITRAEFVTMVVRALDLRIEGKSTFNNITDDKWYAEYLSVAKDVKLIDGTAYNAEGIISRIEMAKIISRAHALLNNKEVKYIGNLEFTDVLQDNADYVYVGYAKENGLINGYPDATFRPVEDTTRAEAIEVINKLICR